MRRRIAANEEGFILVLTLLLLVVVTLLGVSATSTSVFEATMSANDSLYKKAFYQADGGSEIGIKLTFDNAVCVQTQGGFEKSPEGTTIVMEGNAMDFASSTPGREFNPPVSDANRAAVYYPDPSRVGDNKVPHTNLLAQGSTVYSPGSGLHMISGYQGLGLGSAAGGTHFYYQIYAQHIGVRNSEVSVAVGWRLSTSLLNSTALSDCSDMYK